MTEQDFEKWYEEHLNIPSHTFDGNSLSYEIKYENGDTYEAKYTLNPSYNRDGFFPPSMDDYDFECYINGTLVKRNSDWVA